METKDGAGLNDGHKIFPYQAQYIVFLDLDSRKRDKHIIVKWLLGKMRADRVGKHSVGIVIKPAGKDQLRLSQVVYLNPALERT